MIVIRYALSLQFPVTASLRIFSSPLVMPLRYRVKSLPGLQPFLFLVRLIQFKIQTLLALLRGFVAP